MLDTWSSAGSFNVGRDPRKEMRWRFAFSRLSCANRITREQVTRALELSGFPNAERAMVKEVYDEITKLATLTLDEFLRLVPAFELKRQRAYREAFQRADQDGSGNISVEELAAVLREFNVVPTRRALKQIVDETDLDQSGELCLEEFERLMESLRSGEGFTRSEQAILERLFARMDRNKAGRLMAASLPGAILWLGHLLGQEELDEVLSEFDMTSAGSLDYHEFLICMRKVVEREITAVRLAFAKYDPAATGSIPVSNVHDLLRSLDYVFSHDAVVEAALEAGAETEATLEELLDILQLCRKREGLSLEEIAEVDVAFKRYDSEGNGSINSVDVGKALRWFGYHMPFEVQQGLVDSVDVDQSGRLDLHDFQILIRLFRQREIKEMEQVFCRHSGSESGTLDATKVLAAFRHLDMVGRLGVEPAIAAEDLDRRGCASMKAFVRAGIQYREDSRREYQRNAGYTNKEVVALRAAFEKCDTDHDGGVTFTELRGLIRSIFPVMTDKLRARFETFMREATTTSSRPMDFQDVIRVVRQFHDIQAQEMVDKEMRAVEEAGFSWQEVHSFRELFDKAKAEGARELSVNDVRQMVSCFCPLGERNAATLAAEFQKARRRLLNEEGTPGIDFPEFLWLMKALLELNFGNIKGSESVKVSQEAPRRKSSRKDF